MANTKSAKKKARQDVKRRAINLSRKSAIKTATKKVLESIEKNDPIEKTQKLFNEAQASLMRAKNKGVLHANTVARRVSNLAKKVTAVQTQQ